MLDPVDEPKIGRPPSETKIREREPLDLADLTLHLHQAEAEARAAQHRARLLEAEARAAQRRARLLRTQIQAEERRQGRPRSVMSSGSLGRTVGAGILAGVGAGISFALFMMFIDAVLGNGFLDWLRQSARIALGSSLVPGRSQTSVLVVGLIVHVTLAALYGAIFAVAARYIKLLQRELLIATMVFGLGIWVLNFYVFSPWLFPWFDDSPDLVQFIAHTVFYGLPLGAVLLEFTPTGGLLASNRVRN
jgi:hypothetical protein